ncbi:DUF1642 domain-containing protein [Streptococcus pneumoniae]|uniref:DUF1642 domain-containing protein n=1 Tax=Streptococcus pneumoniae TaxID=1313 RepID=UPI000B58CD0E|nr:DUF1642 domain-containing protein [Streptococcus pneumoniae]SNP68216.1 phage protein [Streptococcus pneumoniae]
MKVQRLIEKYKELYENVFDFGAKLACQLILQDLEQLDEPSKVKVPQFVADWITHSKNIGRSLFGAMSIFEENFEIKKWMQWAENQETFALAWIFGYEVEEEKRYTVVMKATKQPLYYNAGDKKLFFSLGGLATNFTQKQLEEADFGWVFDCPGVKIEEVV